MSSSARVADRPSCSARGSTDVVDSAACRDAGRRREAPQRRRRRARRPEAMCWFDVVVPAGDPRFASGGRRRRGVDALARRTHRSRRWRGRSVGDACRSHPSDDRRRLVALVCFAGLGPGEVLAAGASWSGSASGATAGIAVPVHGAQLRWAPDVLVGLLAAPRPAGGRRAAAGGGRPPGGRPRLPRRRRPRCAPAL